MKESVEKQKQMNERNKEMTNDNRGRKKIWCKVRKNERECMKERKRGLVRRRKIEK